MTRYILHYFVQGAAEWKSIPLQEGAFSIGRSPGNELIINDPNLSRFHGRLQVNPDGVWLIDLESSSGVLLNQAPIPPKQWVPLPPDTTATLGPVSIVIQALETAQPAAVPQPAAAQPAMVSVPASAYSNPKPADKRRSGRGVLWGVVLVVLCLCLVGIGVGIWRLYPNVSGLLEGGRIPIVGGSGLAGETDFVPAPPKVESTQSITAGQGGISDEYGASLAIPAETLPGEEAITMQSASLSADLQTELEKSYQVDSLAYSVQSTNLDGAGRAELRLPAPSPNSRLAVLVDDQYLAIMPGAPENGFFNVQPFLGAPGAVDSYPTLASATLPNRYFVVTPNEGASQPPTGQAHLARPAEQPDVTSCIPNIWRGNRCRTNQAGSVYVLYWNTEMPASLGGGSHLQAEETIDQLIRSVTAIMTSYQQAGFTNAAISGSNPVYLVISMKEKEPNYSQKTGNIYLGWGVVSELLGGKGNCTLAHELFHWIQDDAYVMNAAALVNDRAWWLEMGAENGSYLIDAACIGHTISTYGVAEVGEQLAWQATPFHWDWGEGARYVQAVQMYISICDDGSNCAISPAEFASLTNAGSYPSSLARDDYYRNANDMARFTLGSQPIFGRGDATIPDAFRTGKGFGDYIWLKNTQSSIIDTSLSGTRIRKTGDYEVTVETTISHGGVYPLWVSNGKGSSTGGGEGFTAVPGLLTISPGTPVWYSLDNGIPEYHDGAEELVLGPLSDKLGIGLIRLAAAAHDADKTFKAVVGPLDLSGDWASILSESRAVVMNCPDSDEPMEAIDFAGFLAAYGTFVSDPGVTNGTKYTWEGSLGEVDADVLAQATILVEPDKIVLDYLIDIPRPTDSSWLPWPGGSPGVRLSAAPTNQNTLPANLALLGFLALGGVGTVYLQTSGTNGPRLALKRWLPLALVALLAGVWLSGCFGFAFWGTFQGSYTYTHIALAEEQNLPADAAELGEVKWVLDGTASMKYDIHTLVVTEDADGNTTETEETCYIEYTSKLQTLVGPADMVPPPDSE